MWCGWREADGRHGRIRRSSFRVRRRVDVSKRLSAAPNLQG